MRGYYPKADRGSPPWASAARAEEAAENPPARGLHAGSRSSILPEDWETLSWLALDFETTGLDPKAERVVEIGAIRFRVDASGYGEVGALASLVDPQRHIPAVTSAIHGIFDEDVEGAPFFADLVPALLGLAGDAVIIAHNAPFDLSFLRAELARAGFPAAANRVLDTRIAAKQAFPALRSYRLGDLAAAFDLGSGKSHRALDDARTCIKLFRLCAKRLNSVTKISGPSTPS